MRQDPVEQDHNREIKKKDKTVKVHFSSPYFGNTKGRQQQRGGKEEERKTERHDRRMRRE